MSKHSHSGLLLTLLAWAAGWSCTGWGLGFLGRLGHTEIWCALIVITLLSVLAGRMGSGWRHEGGWIRLRRFRRHRWAQGYLLLLLLSVIGGLCFEPGNIDALTYRLPRLFHWVDAGQSFWIPTDNLRMNVTTRGFEWLGLPGWALAHSTRSFVLPNLVAYVLLPGLVFSVLRALGVHGRVARRWMWLLPSGYGYLLQAGSIGNDLMGAVYFLAAIDLALRARRISHGGRSLAASILGMGLSTGIKLSNAPLGLVWLIAARPSLRRWWRSPWILGAVLVGGLASAAPTMWANYQKTGSISGDPDNLLGAKPKSAAVALAGNVILLTTQNLTPPIFPIAARWNAASTSWLQGPLAPLKAGFPRLDLRANELAQEEWAGLGVMLVLLVLYGRWGGRAGPRRNWTWKSEGGTLILATWAALAIYSLTIASEMPARLLLPFYPLLLGGLLVRTHPRGPIAGPWGNRLAALTILLAAFVLAMGPARPLWPWQPVLGWLETKAPSSPLIARAKNVYTVYAARPDHLAELRTAWPASEKRIGFIGTSDDSEVSLWRPYGDRSVETQLSLLALPDSIHYIVTRFNALPESVARQFQDAEKDGKIARVFDRQIVVKASAGPEHWVVWQRLVPPSPDTPSR